MHIERVMGYALLAVGVVMVVVAVVDMVAVFTGLASPPSLFSFQDINIPNLNGSTTVIPGAELSQLPNLFFWFLLMSFVAYAGGKIASIGVDLIKEVHLQVEETFAPPKEV